jgi:undecaprenyl-diphosphatase
MRKRGIIALILVIVLLVIVFIFDISIMRVVGQTRTLSLDYTFLSIAFASNILIIFFFLTTLFLWQERKRRWIIPLWLSCLFSVLISTIIKIIVQRPRPFEQDIVSAFRIVFYFLQSSFQTWNFSFPSFQAMLVFSALPILNKEFPKFKYIWLIFACLVAYSRVYFGVHYLSDVLAGAIIGYLIGFAMVWLEGKYGFGKKIIKRLKLTR